MNSVEGRIRIHLQPDKPPGQRVRLQSSRPLHAARLMVGKTPEQALAMIPMLFSVCGNAQATVAIEAMQPATDPRLSAARELLVQVETAREHLMRIFLDWPKLLPLTHKHERLAWLGQMQSEFRHALFDHGNAFRFDSRLQPATAQVHELIDRLEQRLSQQVFGCAPEYWLQIHDFTTLEAWAERHTTPAPESIRIICERNWLSQGGVGFQPLPAFEPDTLTPRFHADDADNFIAEPEWQGKQHETTPLARQHHAPLIQSLLSGFGCTLITRWCARLVELAHAPTQMRRTLQAIHDLPAQAAAKTVHDDVTRTAGIEAARGRLIHHVRIAQGRIQQYRILAPTEWNFHPRGLVSQALANITARDPDELSALAHTLINTIDPCVGYELRLH